MPLMDIRPTGRLRRNVTGDVSGTKIAVVWRHLYNCDCRQVKYNQLS